MNRNGFTLLEVLVTLAILTIVLGSLYASYTSNLDAVQSARYGAVMRQAARLALDRMGRDLMCALDRAAGAPEGLPYGFRLVDAAIGDHPADRLEFVATTHVRISPGAPDSDLARISYFLERDPDGEALSLYRRDDPALAGGGRGYRLAAGVTALEILCVDAQGSEQATWSTGQGLPSLVTVRLRLVAPDGRERAFSTRFRPELGPPLR